MSKKKFYLALTGGIAFGVSWGISNYFQNGVFNYSGFVGALVWFVVIMLLPDRKGKQKSKEAD